MIKAHINPTPLCGRHAHTHWRPRLHTHTFLVLGGLPGERLPSSHAPTPHAGCTREPALLHPRTPSSLFHPSPSVLGPQPVRKDGRATLTRCSCRRLRRAAGNPDQRVWVSVGVLILLGLFRCFRGHFECLLLLWILEIIFYRIVSLWAHFCLLALRLLSCPHRCVSQVCLTGVSPAPVGPHSPIHGQTCDWCCMNHPVKMVTVTVQCLDESLKEAATCCSHLTAASLIINHTHIFPHQHVKVCRLRGVSSHQDGQMASSCLLQ